MVACLIKHLPVTCGLKMASAALSLTGVKPASVWRLQVVTATSHTLSALAKLAPAAATWLASLVQRYTDTLVHREPGVAEQSAEATCRWVQFNCGYTAAAGLLFCLTAGSDCPFA